MWRYYTGNIKGDFFIGNTELYTWFSRYLHWRLFKLINEQPTAPHRILPVGGFNLDQMLSENVVKVGLLIQIFNLSHCSQYSTHIHMEYWIWDWSFKFKYCFFSSVTLQWSPCSFFPNLMNYIYIEFSFQQFTFWLSLYIHTYLCPYLLPYIYLTKVKIFSGNNHQSKAT